MRNTARPRNTTDRSMSIAELLCLGVESTRGAVGGGQSGYENVSFV